MRKMPPGPIIVFSLIICLAMVLSVGTTAITLALLPLGPFEGILLLAGAICFLYAYAIFFYRVLLRIIPLKEGDIKDGSREAFCHHVYVLFFLMLFRPLTCTKLVPIPLNRLIYLAVGARLGKNTYCAGYILDPPLTFIGANTIIGHDAVLYSHAIEGQDLSLDAIRIGDGVTIGAKSVIMSGVNIANDAIVAAGSVVRKHTQIPAGELWGGVPARCLRKKEAGNSSHS
jgi:hypothetical protein